MSGCVSGPQKWSEDSRQRAAQPRVKWVGVVGAHGGSEKRENLYPSHKSTFSSNVLSGPRSFFFFNRHDRTELAGESPEWGDPLCIRLLVVICLMSNSHTTGIITFRCPPLKSTASVPQSSNLYISPRVMNPLGLSCNGRDSRSSMRRP